MRRSLWLASLMLVFAMLLAACPAPAPVAEAPMAEEAATEAPAAEEAATEAPAAEEAATEAPAAEEAATEAPAAEEAATEAPAAEVPASEPASAPLDAQAAADAALAAVPGGAVIEIDRGTERGLPIWEVLVRNPNGGGTELYLDAATGDVIKQETAGLPPYARASAPTITASAAIAAALSATPGTVEEVGLGQERGSTVWEVLVAGANGRVEHYIDATTGDIIKQEAA